MRRYAPLFSQARSLHVDILLIFLTLLRLWHPPVSWLDVSTPNGSPGTMPLSCWGYGSELGVEINEGKEMGHRQDVCADAMVASEIPCMSTGDCLGSGGMATHSSHGPLHRGTWRRPPCACSGTRRVFARSGPSRSVGAGMMPCGSSPRQAASYLQGT